MVTSTIAEINLQNQVPEAQEGSLLTLFFLETFIK